MTALLVFANRHRLYLKQRKAIQRVLYHGCLKRLALKPAGGAAFTYNLTSAKETTVTLVSRMLCAPLGIYRGFYALMCVSILTLLRSSKSLFILLYHLLSGVTFKANFQMESHNIRFFNFYCIYMMQYSLHYIALLLARMVLNRLDG